MFSIGFVTEEDVIFFCLVFLINKQFTNVGFYDIALIIK
jgi:hypothetical protein